MRCNSKCKRILPILLTLALLLSTGNTAFAVGTGTSGQGNETTNDSRLHERSSYGKGSPSNAGRPVHKGTPSNAGKDSDEDFEEATSSNAWKMAALLDDGVEVKDIDSLIAAVDKAQEGSSVYIQINDPIEVTKEIVIGNGKEVHFVGEGELIRQDTLEKSASMIRVEEGGELYLEGIILDGNNLGDNQTDDSGVGPMMNILGKATLADGLITGVKCNGVTVNGAKAQFHMTGGRIGDNADSISYVLVMNHGSFVMDDGEISDNSLSRNQKLKKTGVVFVCNDGIFTMNGGKITRNQCHGLGNTVSVQGGTTATPDETAGSFIMNDGEISSNECWNFSSVTVGTWASNSNDKTIAYFEMNGGVISDNFSSYSGGGISIYGNARAIINDGTISGNKSITGGGISVNDTYAMAKPNMTHEEWQNKRLRIAALTMNGGRVVDNYAYTDSYSGGGSGGGIYIASDNVIFNGGEISGNTAEDLGGGIYVACVPYVVRMHNTVITDNNASALGGGIWSCPTGDVEVGSSAGGAVFDNTALDGAAGDDYAAVKKDAGYGSTLRERILGGGKVVYYADGGIVDGSSNLGIPDPKVLRYNPEKPGDPAVNMNHNGSRLALKAYVSDSAKDLAKSQATLVITGNSAVRGGGIGTNGSVIINTEKDDWKLNVIKKWEGIPEESFENKSVTINLKIGNYLLDAVKLSKANNWAGSFRNLPDPDTLGNLKITVVEEQQEYDASYSAIERDNAAKTLSITVTNSKSEPGPQPDPETGSLTVSKTVSGGGASQLKAFSFTVTLSDASINGIYGGLTFANGVSSFTLKHGESRTAVGLPAGVSYQVKESDNSGYRITSTGESGIIAKGNAAAAAFDNYKGSTGGGSGGGTTPGGRAPGIQTGSLTVVKTVTGVGADPEKLFSFTVTLGDASVNGTYGEMFFVNGAARFTLKHNESKAASGLPSGMQYVVTESDSGDYNAVAADDTGTITAGMTVTARFVNEKETPAVPGQYDDLSPIPKTEDQGDPLFWILLFGAALTGFAGVFPGGMKRRSMKSRP